MRATAYAPASPGNAMEPPPVRTSRRQERQDESTSSARNGLQAPRRSLRSREGNQIAKSHKKGRLHHEFNEQTRGRTISSSIAVLAQIAPCKTDASRGLVAVNSQLAASNSFCDRDAFDSLRRIWIRVPTVTRSTAARICVSSGLSLRKRRRVGSAAIQASPLDSAPPRDQHSRSLAEETS